MQMCNDDPLITSGIKKNIKDGKTLAQENQQPNKNMFKGFNQRLISQKQIVIRYDDQKGGLNYQRLKFRAGRLFVAI
jgi:hypothetical protein